MSTPPARPSRLHDEPVIGDINGCRVLFVVPVIPDDAPPAVRETITRRRLATITGVCPCGARRPDLSRQARRAAQRGAPISESFLRIEHESDCAALDLDAVFAWDQDER